MFYFNIPRDSVAALVDAVRVGGQWATGRGIARVLQRHARRFAETSGATSERESPAWRSNRRLMLRVVA